MGQGTYHGGRAVQRSTAALVQAGMGHYACEFPSSDIHNHRAPFPLLDPAAGERGEFAAPQAATDQQPKQGAIPLS